MTEIRSNSKTLKRSNPSKPGNTGAAVSSAVASRGVREAGPSGVRGTSDLQRTPGSSSSRPQNSRAVTQQQATTADRVTQREKKTPDPAVVKKSANELYRSMKGGLGWGTDEKRLFQALEGKSPEEIAAIKAEYKDHYDRDLESDIKGELSGVQEKKAMALLEAKSEASDADSLRLAMKGLGTNESDIMKTLKDKNPDQIAKIKQEYQERHGRSLDADLKKELSGRRLEQAQSLLKSDQTGSDVADLQRAMEGLGTNEALINKTLEGKSDDERKALIEAYEAKTNRTLEDDLKKELGGSDLTRASATLKGDEASADAARLVKATKGLGTNEKEINSVLEGKDQDERDAIVAAYKQQTGKDLDATLKRELSGTDLEKSQSLLESGSLSEAEQIRLATAGFGTNEDAVRKALEGKSKTEIEAIRKDYRERYNKDLDSVLKSELSGRDEFEVGLALEGKPENAKEALEIANKRHAYERKGLTNMVSRTVMDRVSDNGKILDRNNARANEFAKQAMADGKMSEAETARLEQLTGFQTDDVQTYQESKDSVGETASTVAATAASVAVVVGTAGTATPLVATALMASGAGAAAKVTVSAGVSGKGYGVEQLVTDTALGAVEGVGIKGGAAAGQVARRGVSEAFEATAKAAGREGLERTATRKALEATADGAVDGFVGGTISGAGHTAAQSETWEGGVVEGLGQVVDGGLKGGAIGTVAGGATGRAAEIGFEKAASGISRLKGKGSASTEGAPIQLRSSENLDGAAPSAKPESPDGKASTASVKAEVPGSSTKVETPPSYEYKKPKTFDSNNSVYDPADVAKELSEASKKNLESFGPEQAQKYQSSTEWSIIKEQSEKILQKAHKEGRISAEALTNRDVQQAVGFKVIQDLKAGGVRLDPDNFKLFRTVDAHKGKVPNSSSTRVTTDFRSPEGVEAVMISQRAMEPNPTVVTKGSRPVKVYNGSPADVTSVTNAVTDMDAHAPELMKHLKDVHMSKTLGGSISREARFDPQTGVPVRGPVDGMTSTNGMVFGGDSGTLTNSSGSMLIKKAPMFTGPGRLKQMYPDGVPESALRETSVKGTIYHETAHLLDRSKAEGGKFWSERDGSPFLQKGELKRDDFVSDYAMTNPREDFAETARFVTELGARSKPDVLAGKELTPALRQKLTETAEAIGADPKVLEKIDGWNKPDAVPNRGGVEAPSTAPAGKGLASTSEVKPNSGGADALPREVDKGYGHGHSKHGPPGVDGVRHQQHRDKLIEKGRDGMSYTWFESEDALAAAVKEAPDHLAKALEDPVKKAAYDAWLAHPRAKGRFGFRFSSDAVKGQGIVKDGDGLINQGNSDFNGAYVEYAWVQKGSELVPKMKTIYPTKVD